MQHKSNKKWNTLDFIQNESKKQHAAACERKSDEDIWEVVASKKKKMGKIATPLLPTTIVGNNNILSKSQQKKAVLSQNKFYLSKALEKKLHSPIFDQKESQSLKPQNLKCFQRNQRRARKRAEKRAAAELQKLEQSLIEKSEEKEIFEESFARKIVNSQKSTPLPPTKSIKSTSMATPSELIVLPNNSSFGILDLPDAILNLSLSFLSTKDVLLFGASCRRAHNVSENKYLWKLLFAKEFNESKLMSKSLVIEINKSSNFEDILYCMDDGNWKLAYQLTSTNMLDYLRCSYTKKSFFRTILGVGVDFTVNPKTKQVDYIKMGQDLWSETAFRENPTDAFGNSFKVFLPFHFSDDHFRRALPIIQQTLLKLSNPSKKLSRKAFKPSMILDVLPKIMNTFIVLFSDEGITTSHKAFLGLLYAYRLFLALAKEYPQIRKDALLKLRHFTNREENRTKKRCAKLGELLPLLMIVDEKDFSWRHIQEAYLEEYFTRSVLWVCKAHPKLERTHTSNGAVESKAESEERITLTREAMTVSIRLLMFNVYFLRACCRGNLNIRSYKCDIALRRPISGISAEEKEGVVIDGKEVNEKKDQLKNQSAAKIDPLSFTHFRKQAARILECSTWHQFYSFINSKCPSSKASMAQMLRGAVRRSRKRGYHKAGMDFSRIHASGTSTILAKGQQYSASSDLKKVIFSDSWGFSSSTKFLDATCLVYEGNKLLHTVDYSNRTIPGDHSPIIHSGDQIEENRGTHTIHLDLDALKESITACVFVLSAWADATLSDITTASVSFCDADSPPGTAPLCEYNLDAHDKVPHLTSVIMCKLYRARGGWHVVSIGDSHRGSADRYGPIYKAVQKIL